MVLTKDCSKVVDMLADSDGELLKDYPKYCYSDKDAYEYVAQIQFNFFKNYNELVRSEDQRAFQNPKWT